MQKDVPFVFYDDCLEACKTLKKALISAPIAETPENPNDISISDAETQSGNDPETSDSVNDNVHVDAQPSSDNDIEIEPTIDLDNPQS